MAVGVKICGLKTPEAVDAALAGGAAYAGFVFFAASPRHLEPSAAGALRARLAERIPAVAVVVDPDDQSLAAILRDARPDLIQLHGRESPARVAEIRARFARPVVKAIPVATAADLAAAPGYAAVADMLLFDAKADPDETRPGGHARRFNWALLKDLPATVARPWFLAGGLTAETLAEAVASSGARLLDVSSGVERAPGEKDPLLVRRFLDTAKALHG